MCALDKYIGSHDENRKIVQEKLHTICEGWRKQIDELERKVNSELEEKFAKEDNRLQAVLHNLRTASNDDKISEALRKAKAELLVMQKYELKDNPPKHTIAIVKTKAKAETNNMKTRATRAIQRSTAKV